jgi:dihydroorotate dehydrogenase (NAD+) catalytic subunit
MVTLRGGPVEIGHIALRNHLLLAAGILGTTGASLARVLRAGAGGVVTKSIGPVPFPGHAGPCVAVLKHGLLNAMGLPNPSQDFQEELASLKDAPVVVSIFGASPEEFRTVASWFADIAVGFELNLSCPHAEGYGASVGTDPDLVLSITREVASIGVPTWVKLTPNVTDITEIGLAAEKGGAAALVAINTVRAMRISTTLRRPALGNRFGGLSGPAIFPIALRCVYELYDACSIPIIGCGGISSEDDVVEMMMAGASAVEIGTAAYPDLQIFATLSERLYSHDGVPPEEIVGCAHE